MLAWCRNACVRLCVRVHLRLSGCIAPCPSLLRSQCEIIIWHRCKCPFQRNMTDGCRLHMQIIYQSRGFTWEEKRDKYEICRLTKTYLTIKDRKGQWTPRISFSFLVPFPSSCPALLNLFYRWMLGLTAGNPTNKHSKTTIQTNDDQNAASTTIKTTKERSNNERRNTTEEECKGEKMAYTTSRKFGHTLSIVIFFIFMPL